MSVINDHNRVSFSMSHAVSDRIRYASLMRDDREALLELSRRHPSIARVDEAKLTEILDHVAEDRLGFAERRASLGAALIESLPADEEMARRDAVTACYDACHHALRALAIGFEGWDPIGHQETLDATTDLFQKDGDLGKRFDWMNLGRPIQDVIGDLRTERQAAEWDVYNRDDEGNPRLDYEAASKTALRIAQETVRTVRMALADRRTGGVR